jgi:5S rRNA maturation endonuclease (ribonuclease M5)
MYYYGAVQEKETLQEILEGAGAVFDGDSCTCPYHMDSNPSAGIFVDTQGHWRFRCFVCDLTLDYYDISVRSGNIKENIMEPQPERTKYVYNSYEEALGTYVNKYEYGDSEGRLLVTKIRLQDMATGKKTYRMVVPYYGGFLRKGPPSPWPLYNIPRLNIGGKKGLVVVEGEKCVDALRELGIPATTALSSTSVSQTDWSPIYGRDVVIWPDNDKVGYKYANAVERLLSPHCKVTQVKPDSLGLGEKEDAADYIERGNGSDAIRAILREASKHTPAQGVLQYIDGMIDGSIRAVDWPWPMLHRYSQALLPGTITVLVGVPGSSKSMMLMEALAYWIDNKVPVALHVLEEDKEFHLLRALAQRAAMPKLTNTEWVYAHPNEARAAWAEHSAYLEEMGKHLYAQPDKQVNLNEIILWMTEQLDAGCRIVAVDPITAAGRDKDVWRADEEFILASKKLADQYKASLVFVTHPVKADSAPYLGNIMGGAAWQRFVQNVFWLEKTQGIKDGVLVDGRMVLMNRLLTILKARNAEEMITGKIAFNMATTLKFNELGEFKEYDI